MRALMLGAIGVVYGDIGTSPLYTVKEIFDPHDGVALNHANLIGAISVIIWALILVVTLKYVVLVLRADNNGEGGSLALAALAAMGAKKNGRSGKILLLAGVLGATFFYGDGVITPAISVLGAVEGLGLVAPSLGQYVVPVSVLVIAVLFFVQRLGTGTVGRYFGPLIALWFGVLAIVGVVNIASAPSILEALNPAHAISFLMHRGWALFFVVGAIVLALTGAEALYADLGHFGRRPIQWAWMSLVFPALALNYLGQGALLLRDVSAIENPFYRLFPSYMVIPVLLLATMAAIIASQAVISGAYSITKQAMQLGYLPRMRITYTSAKESGQIYIAAINWMLMAGVMAAMVGFGSSSALASAYGIAVTMTMLITSVLLYFVMREQWQWPVWMAWLVCTPLVLVDAVLVLGCLIKFFDGGWFPLALACGLFFLMRVWAQGRHQLVSRIHQEGVDLEQFVERIDPQHYYRCPRTAVYPVADATTVPHALLHNMKHNSVLHERNVVLNVVFHDVPWVPMQRRIEVQPLGHGFWRIVLNFGFMNRPDVPQALELAYSHGLTVSLFETTYFLSRDNVVAAAHSSAWQRLCSNLFAYMNRNASNVASFFRLPANAIVEIGTQVRI
nr:potassium transporter Kup [Lampropedia puyangensis]